MMLSLAQLRRDGGTQFRKAIDALVVADYAMKIERGEKLPDPLAFYDGSDYWLADGFQTVGAHEKLRHTEIDVNVKTGTRRDAVLYAATEANRNHGVPFTREEKRDRVQALLNDPEWSKWSNTLIAEKCGVDEKLVRTMRGGKKKGDDLGSAEVTEEGGGAAAKSSEDKRAEPKPEKRIGRDGVARTVPPKKNKRQVLDPESEVGKMLAEKPLPGEDALLSVNVQSKDPEMLVVLQLARGLGADDARDGVPQRTTGTEVLADMKGCDCLTDELRQQIEGSEDLLACLLEDYLDGYDRAGQKSETPAPATSGAPGGDATTTADNESGESSDGGGTGKGAGGEDEGSADRVSTRKAAARLGERYSIEERIANLRATPFLKNLLDEEKPALAAALRKLADEMSPDQSGAAVEDVLSGLRLVLRDESLGAKDALETVDRLRSARDARIAELEQQLATAAGLIDRHQAALQFIDDDPEAIVGEGLAESAAHIIRTLRTRLAERETQNKALADQVHDLNNDLFGSELKRAAAERQLAQTVKAAALADSIQHGRGPGSVDAVDIASEETRVVYDEAGPAEPEPAAEKADKSTKSSGGKKTPEAKSAKGKRK